MKILVPYIGDEKINGTLVRGGIERFVSLLYKAFPSYVIPIQITKKDRENRKTRYVIDSAIEKYAPDALINNNIAYPLHNYEKYQKYNVPLINIIHEPLDGDIRFGFLGSQLQTLMKNGEHVYFVSEHQFNFHRKMYHRREGVNLQSIHGFIRSAYSPTIIPAKNLQYDAVSIGRNSAEKDPFRLHRSTFGSNLRTLVITNDQQYKSDRHNNYVKKNSFWHYPQQTFRNLPHEKVIRELKKGRVFLSTCSKESWGITVLEALSCGLPVILLTDSSEKHSSEVIPANRNHYHKLRKNCSSIELYDSIVLLGKISYEERCNIAEETQKKHSFENWKRQIEEIISRRLC